MGQEIKKSKFSQQDFAEFRSALRSETGYLMQLFKQEKFASCEGLQIGLELETWLSDHSYQPAPENQKFLEKVNNPEVVPELSKFNAEINATPHSVSQDCLSSISKELHSTWSNVQTTCSDMDLKMLMIGSMPTLRDDHLTVDNMSDMERYRAMNDQVLALRRGYPITLDIMGRDHLRTQHKDIMLEAAATSFQIHLRPPADKTVRYFNASFISCVPLVAIAANTPYLFGKDLWAETRIPIFEQGVFIPSFKNSDGGVQTRVTFGSGYVRRSMLELFLENLDGYPVLLPVKCEKEREALAHVRLHNGNIWRWNRPIVGVEPDGAIHLRIEQRVPSAGPTICDMVANMAFYIGLTHHLALEEIASEDCLPFETLRSNFYQAAQSGLNAPVEWVNGKQVLLKDLIEQELVPRASEGLANLGIDPGDIKRYLDDIVLERVKSGQNGATWQRAFVKEYGEDFQKLTAAYFANQEKGDPVHTWSI